MSRIKAVLSDLGNVVVPFDNRRPGLALKGLMSEFRTEEEVLKFTSAHQKGNAFGDFERGLITSAQFIEALRNYLGVEDGVSDKTIEDAYSDLFTINWPVFDLWRSIIRPLKLELVAVTDIDALRYQKLCDMGVMDIFTDVVASYKVGETKKDSPEMLLEAINRVGCWAHEAVFIDDREDCIAKANEVGIHTHLYKLDDHKALEKELMLLGVPLLSI